MQSEKQASRKLDIVRKKFLEYEQNLDIPQQVTDRAYRLYEKERNRLQGDEVVDTFREGITSKDIEDYIETAISLQEAEQKRVADSLQTIAEQTPKKGFKRILSTLGTLKFGGLEAPTEDVAYIARHITYCIVAFTLLIFALMWLFSYLDLKGTIYLSPCEVKDAADMPVDTTPAAPQPASPAQGLPKAD